MIACSDVSAERNCVTVPENDGTSVEGSEVAICDNATTASALLENASSENDVARNTTSDPEKLDGEISLEE